MFSIKKKKKNVYNNHVDTRLHIKRIYVYFEA